MKPQLFKKYTLKVMRWLFSIILMIAIIFIICLTTLNSSDLQWRISIGILGFIHLLLIIFILSFQANSKLMIRLNFNIEYSKMKNKIVKVQSKISLFSWIFILIIEISMYFIEIGGMCISEKLSFNKILSKYWWISLIFAIISTLILTLYILMTEHLLNKDESIERELIEFYYESKNSKNYVDEKKNDEKKQE